MDQDEVWRAIDAQRLRLVRLLRELTDEQWRTPSLCAGWTVRDVAAHLTFAQSTLPQILGEFVRHPGPLNRSGRDSAIRRARQPTDQLIARIEAMVGSQRHITVVTPKETLIDILVHSQDVAIPLGRPFELDRDAAAFAATRAYEMGWPFWAKRRFKRYTLTATDADWSTGSGPEQLKAPIGTLLLAVTGRNIPSP
jgi:uncharacterized protein (TIGR03083 family)